MVKRGEKPVRSANAGELSKDFAGRVDVKQYYSGALRMKGFEPVPQGGFQLMPGTIDLGPVRGSFELAAQSNVVENFGPHTGTQTIWTCDFAETEISVITFTGLATSAGTMDVTVEVWQAGTGWIAMGAAQTVGTSAMPRTFARAPGDAVAATAARVVATFSESATAALGTVAVRAETGPVTTPRYRDLRQTLDQGYLISAQAGFVDIFEGDGFAATVAFSPVTEAMLPDLGFYAEVSTIGLFHGDLETPRIRRVSGNSHEWTSDLWPYENIPGVDYGGTYAKTDDKWEVFLRWSETTALFVSVSVNGEQTPAIELTKTDGTPTTTGDFPDFAKLAADIATAIDALPSIGTGCAGTAATASGNSVKLTFEFAGELAGEEYEFSAQVTNTTAASAIAYHTQIGETDFEPLLSDARGWPGLAALVQDRLGYGRLKGQPGALALSRAGEYFDLNITATGATAGRLDRLRSQTSETILAVRESKYLALWTNAAMWFATNRVITATEPLNFVVTSEIGIRANCEPAEIEGRIFYVSNNGSMVLSARYDELETGFAVQPETIINSHLVTGVIRTATQIGADDTDASRLWLLRDDGRLVQGQMIASQEVFGLAEWLAADGGLVREIAGDVDNHIRLVVERDGSLRHERMDPDCLFQQAVTTTTDMAGLVSGLPYPDDTTVWAEADGYILGPFTVAAAAIDLGDAYTDVTVGRWIAPVFEDMPHVMILPSDEVVWRPGRIHTASLNVIDTQSIAIGANGEPAEDVPLLEAGDPADAPPPAKTKLVEVTGLLGAKVGTTLVITQVKPGWARVRDYSTGERL